MCRKASTASPRTTCTLYRLECQVTACCAFCDENLQQLGVQQGGDWSMRSPRHNMPTHQLSPLLSILSRV